MALKKVLTFLYKYFAVIYGNILHVTIIKNNRKRVKMKLQMLPVNFDNLLGLLKLNKQKFR